MLYVGLDLSRKRLGWLALDQDGEFAGNGALPPDRDALVGLSRRLGDAPVLAVIESMSGARFVHDRSSSSTGCPTRTRTCSAAAAAACSHG
jgi:hypothetical protein